MSKHFNNLSPAEAERLALLLEEMGEVQQIIGKILRHGYTSYHPDNPFRNNRELLEKEIGDVYCAIRMMCANKDIDGLKIKQLMMIKLEKVKQFLHHQKRR